MKRILRLLTLLTVAFQINCIGSTSTSEADFSVDAYVPKYASGFKIQQQENNQKNTDTPSSEGDSTLLSLDETSALIRIFNPWQGAVDVEQQLLLLAEGEQAPRNFAGQVAHYPLRKVICMSSTHVAMFDAIGESDRIVGVSGLEYLSSPKVRQRAKEGKVQEIGFDANINFEVIASQHPDLMLLFGVTGDNSVLTGKLRELGIPYIYIGDYVEESPLGKAEWMVLISKLCGQMQRGINEFEAIASRYNALQQAIASQPTDHRPKVMLNTPYRDNWFMPSSKSHMVRLIEAAGGEYIYPNDQNYSVSIDVEKAYVLARKADVWINLSMFNSLDELTAANPKFRDIPAIRNHRVWNNNKRQTPSGGSDFWESGVVRPDLILYDLHAIFSQNGLETTYYKQLQ